jgi:hypothetical protein
MDSRALAMFIPILALLIPVSAIIMGGLIKLARVRAMESGGVGDGETQARLDTLDHEVALLRQELGETQERLDFAERLLARPESPPRQTP